MTGPADPYAAVADIYDAEYAGASADAAFYARMSLPGPLLVLGCGTGRVCRLLDETRPVTGLDRSEAMLARARATPSRTRWVLGDIRSFDLGTFAEVIVPNGTFAFLHRRDDQLACLQACARALPPGGALTIDLPAPDFALLGTPHTPERTAWEGFVGDRPARRTREVFRRPLAGRIDLVDRYFLDGAYLVTSTLALQLVHPRELEWMCEAAGFWVDALYGDHAGGPLREGCDRIVAKAVRC